MYDLRNATGALNVRLKIVCLPVADNAPDILIYRWNKAGTASAMVFRNRFRRPNMISTSLPCLSYRIGIARAFRAGMNGAIPVSAQKLRNRFALYLDPAINQAGVKWRQQLSAASSS
ncbi:hypothetical protein P775_05110 [Puniceibacterium antarcticum]|uniref:Uncharacterized protein n=1 Tax=Puniceibacterium antarcticum TaxID=1206336 RepID=A0A2G8RIN8_9RHOB|nr:hypothetical protein P775_05110 [Puniceibacterium antarcticum]